MANYAYISKDESYALKHYGVLGMRWGVRKQRPIDPNSKGQRLKRQFKTTMRYGFDRQLAVAKGFHNAKGFRGKVSAIAGSTRKANLSKASANYHKRMAKNSVTRLGKHVHSIASYNRSQDERVYRNRSRMSVGRSAVMKMTGADFWRTNHKTLSGRTTTYGKMAVDQLITGGMVGRVKDIEYLTEKAVTKKKK